MCGGIMPAAHSTGATSGHVATCEVKKLPYANPNVARHAPGATIVVLAPPPERFGFAQAGQAYAAGTIISARSVSATRRIIGALLLCRTVREPRPTCRRW